MSVIAWDGKTLAADRQVTWGSTIGTCQKLFRLDELTAIAVCGRAADIPALIDWAREGYPRENHEALETIRDAEKGSMLVVATSNGCIFYSSTVWPRSVEDKFDAWGSGGDFALGALHAGVDARRAVEVACILSTDCGQGVDAIDISSLRERV